INLPQSLPALLFPVAVLRESARVSSATLHRFVAPFRVPSPGTPGEGRVRVTSCPRASVPPCLLRPPPSSPPPPTSPRQTIDSPPDTQSSRPQTPDGPVFRQYHLPAPGRFAESKSARCHISHR